MTEFEGALFLAVFMLGFTIGGTIVYIIESLRKNDRRNT